ncbi:MAG: DEAD/DEAH box helicase family protein [Acidobacteria bacterium]|nr:DEAD/DEAH box helicase family protein [Acidobacteriota bacterium]MBI3426249.1 DEAD/DEAH box helicase family protein [Acidobacteriota bacterium]
MNERINQIIEYVLDNGEITKDEILNSFDIADEEYAEIKRAILKHQLIEAGAKGIGGFVVKKRAGKTPDDTETSPTFSTEWENEAVQRLCELLQHRELEELLGPVAQTVRQARKYATGEDRRGSKPELAAALIIQHGFDLFREGKAREMIGRHARVEVPRRWHPGKGQAISFVDATGFPPEFAGIPTEDSLPHYEYLEGRFELQELADFQEEVKRQLSESLRSPGRRAIVTLPTGAGKTRVAVETIRDWFKQHYDPSGTANSRSVLWLAHTEELCEQAYTCFRQVWEGATFVSPLMLFRFWGKYTQLDDEHYESLNRIAYQPSVLVSTPNRIVNLIEASDEDRQQILNLLRASINILVIDEAHRAAAPSYRRIVDELVGQDERMSLVGLTATPFRLEYLGNDPEAGTKELREIFANLIEAEKTLGDDPRAELQRRGILATPIVEIIKTPTRLSFPDVANPEEITPEEIEKIDNALKIKADNSRRRMAVFKQILSICEDPLNLILYFGPSVRDSECMAYLLREKHVPAAVVSAKTRDVTRRRIVNEFKAGRIRVLCNCEVLTTGFDAPRITHVVVARPTVSQVLYEQIIGRGLRGPKFGGTDICTILDCEDSLPEDGHRPLLGYQLFRHVWKPRVIQS